jgi:hypothetical protein
MAEPLKTTIDQLFALIAETEVDNRIAAARRESPFAGMISATERVSFKGAALGTAATLDACAVVARSYATLRKMQAVAEKEAKEAPKRRRARLGLIGFDQPEVVKPKRFLLTPS